MGGYHEHHFRNLQRARDGLTNAIVSLESAIAQMSCDDWIEATVVLDNLRAAAGRLGDLRNAASDRFNEHTRHPDFESWRTGQSTFPDERMIGDQPIDQRPVPSPPIPQRTFPNVQAGAALVAKHGGLDKAKMAYQPDSLEFDHIQAYVYVTTGKRPKGWIPPIV